VSRVKTIRSRGGHEIEVVTRTPSRKRRAREFPPSRSMFGGSESVIGERVQKDLDNEEVYAALGDILNRGE
jgi:hypothetical protein